jgi:predicted neuraminidase
MRPTNAIARSVLTRAHVLLVFGLLLAMVGQAAPTRAETDEPYACRQEVYAYDERFPGVHAASIGQLPSGDLLYTFFGGSGEGDDDVAVWHSRMAVGTDDWTHPEVLFDDPGKPEGNSVIWHNGEGRTFVFFVTMQGDGWTEANMRFVYSDDDGHTWSEPRWLREELGWMLGNRAQRLSNGDVILPVYSETPSQADWQVGFAISSDDFQTWDFYPEQLADWPQSPSASIQAEAVELDPGHLLAYMRTGDDFIYSTESFDYGRTWTPAEATDLPNPGARVSLMKLESGNLVLAYNPTNSGRATLRLARSTDGGQTWPDFFDVENAAGQEFSYPQLLQSGDGFIHLAYTHKRMSMRHLVFNEAYISEGEDLASDMPVDTPFYSVTSRALFQAGLTPVNGCDYRPS